MSRYIDADRIVYWIRHTSRDGLEDDIRRVAFKDAIERIPTADVQEVKHAKWVHYGEDIQCSNCLHVSDDICFEGDMDSGYYTVLPHYCSNCGAKMDLEENENEH